MTGTHARATDPATAGTQRRRNKSRDRGVRTRTPEPKEIITAAGHPLDAGVRRELEARLGHDFSQVRVHTDRDSAALAELVGADAVTVGRDIFFAPGMFRPGTDDGRRLLAHELLHTVQSPHQPGALRAGRDLGTVSSPRDAVEREAEQGARSAEPRPEVIHGAAPGWLRYATVRADRFRTEHLDPATLADRLTAGILRSLRGDPTDAAGRVRLQLAGFADELRDSVVSRLERRLPSTDYLRVLELVEESERVPPATDTGRTPEPVMDPAGRDEPSEPERVPAQEERKGAVESEGDKSTRDAGEPDKEKAGEWKGEGEKGSEGKKQDEGEKQDEDEKEGEGEKGEAERATGEGRPKTAPEGAQAGAVPGAALGAVAPSAATSGGPAASTAGTLVAAPEQQPVRGSTPRDLDRRRQAEPAPARPEQVDKLGEAEDSPLERHGLLDDDKAEPREEEQPLDLEPGADHEIETPKDDEPAPPPAPVEPGLKPDDFLPVTDPDVSAVPTADQLSLPAGGSPPAPQQAPSFPEPPPTKAEQVREERENAPDDEAREATPEPPAPERKAASRAEPSALQRQPEPEPETRQDDRTDRDLRPEKPVEQEVGPEPGTAEPAAAADRGDSGIGEPGADGADRASPEGADRGNGPVTSAAATLTTVPEAPPGAPPGPGEPVPLELGTTGDRAGDAPASLDASGVQAPRQDASLEPGGGGCAGPQQPTTEEKTESACTAGKGGETRQEEKPAPPDVSGQDPQSALATAGTLPPDQMRSTLDGVDGAVDRSVDERHARLEADAPTAQRPSGAPRTLHGAPVEAAPAPQVTEHVEREGAENGKDQKKAEGDRAGGRNPAADVSRPDVSDDAANQVTADDVRNMQNAVGEVPTTDPALNATVTAPKVELSGESDPARTDRQAENLRKTSGRILAVGREDTAKPMGEDQIYPDVPAETLTGNVPAGGGTGRRRAGGGTVAGADPGVAAVAQQERGPRIQASVGQAQGRMATEQTKQQQDEAEERRRSQEEQDRAVAENAEAQAGERGQAARQVRTERTLWRGEQDKKTEQADSDATKEHTDKNEEIDTRRTDTDRDVGKRQDEDNKKIQDNRKEAEEKARKEKEAKKEESSGWWGWVKSKVKAAFDALLSVVTGIFDFFRGIINGIIDKFREFANWAIDQARKFAVELIKKLADALVAIGDVLLAAFPELRDRFRKKIEEWRDRAIAKVNEWADKLKAAVDKLLDLLAAGLNKLLGLLEAGLKAAVDMVRNAVVSAIEFAQKAIAALGQFAALVADIAPDPGGWLRKMGGSAREGIQVHLWGAVKTAVRKWFDDKVESVLGLGRMVIDVLLKGCVSMAQIGRMAWQALVRSLPMIIVSIVVEKVVSLIVPAVGAILTIVQGLMAAWGTISRIIAGFGKFFAYLKAVRAGPAACLFAEAVAAGVVALLEFITNFLLSRLKMAAKGVGGRLKAMAQKIMAGLKKAARGPRKALGTMVNRAKDSLRRARQALAPVRRRPSRPASGPRRTPGRTKQSRRPAAERPTSLVGRALDTTRNAAKNALRKVRETTRRLGRKLKNSKLGRALTNNARKVRDAFKRQRDRLRERWNKWRAERKRRRDEHKKRENSPQAKEARLARIISRIRPRLVRLLQRGLTGVVLTGVLMGMRVWYRLTSLVDIGSPAFDITARLNPEETVTGGFRLTGEDIRLLVHEIAQELLKRPDVEKRARRMRLTNARNPSHPIESSEAADLPAAVRYLRERAQHLDVATPGGKTYRVNPAAPRTWKDDVYRVGRDLAPVKEMKTPGETNAFTRGVLAYPQIAQRLADTGLPDQRIASIMRAYVRTGTFPQGVTLEQQALLRNTMWLMFVRESVRNPANLGFAAMTTDLVQRGPSRGGMTWRQAFAEFEDGGATGGRGRFPMSMQNAARATRGVEAEEAGKPPGPVHKGGTAADRAELVRRETELAEAWARAVTKGEGIVGATKDAAVKEGREKITALLMRFYGLH
ncbi:DUF4157 domain-containing protein [Streptomyces sp. AHU1]|uniref:eCIS core domain-containing protein n=1 Tax=Streptomyces sp. AHU1 TaxID=3377215 RepID=UPI003877B4AD